MLEIREIKVTNNYILIELNDSSKYKISEDDYFEYKYKASQQLEDKDLITLKNISNFHNAYLRALNRIKYKDRSEYEIRETLYEEFDLIKPEVDKIINKLKSYDFINDKRYAKEFIERSQLKYHGYNKIKNGLINVKINSDIIEETFIYDSETEYNNGLIFAQNSLKSIRGLNNQSTINKLCSRLLYRGYNNDIISDIIDDLNIAYDKNQEKDLIKKDFVKASRRFSKRFKDFELKTKIFNYLKNRGYKYDLINEIIEEMENNNE